MVRRRLGGVVRRLGGVVRGRRRRLTRAQSQQEPEEDDGVQGLKVPLNGRSVISTWARTWVVLSTIGMLAAMGFAAVGLGGVLLEGNGINKSTVSGALLSIGMGGGACFGLVFNIAVWWGIGRFWSMANPSRAAAMMEKLGIQPKDPEIEHYDDPFIDDAQSIE